MNLKKVVLYNFKSFKGKHTYHFSNLNIIKGKNGSGKSSLIKDAILFALYRYSNRRLEDLPTRGISDECKVILYIDDYKIERAYPSNIRIWKNDKEVELDTNTKKDKFIVETFNDLDFTRKFRIIDLDQGINILEEGKSILRKTLFGLH